MFVSSPRLSRSGPPVRVSFEFFPPKTDEARRQLEKAVHELAPLRPSFVSVTYGALGSTREFTRVNVDGTRNLVTAAALAGIRRIVHVSSNSHIGKNRTRPEARNRWRITSS